MNKKLKYGLIGVGGLFAAFMGFRIVQFAIYMNDPVVQKKHAAEAEILEKTQAAKVVQDKKEKDENYVLMVAALGNYGKTHDILRDPKSFELIDVGSYHDKEILASCMQYRARNGFGGLNVEYSTWVMIGTKVTHSRRPAEWNKYCANKKTTDMAYVVKEFIRRNS